MNPMNILIEGSVFQEYPTGIAKVTLALYNACMKIRPELQLSVMHLKSLVSPFPGYLKKMRSPFWVNKHNWKNHCLEKYISSNPGGICHFPWNGNIPLKAASLFTVMTLHDVLPLMIPDCFKKKEDELEYKFRVQNDIQQADLIITDSDYSKTRVLAHFRCPKEPVIIYPASTLEPALETDCPGRPDSAPGSLAGTMQLHNISNYLINIG